MFLTPSFSKRYEKLPVTIFNEAADAAKIIVDEVIKQSNEKAKKGENLVLALASTSTCLAVYDEMINAVKAKRLSFKNIEVFNMDDFYPLDRNELQSHYRFIKECLVDDVDVPAKNVHYIKSNKMDDVQKYCKDFEDEIAKVGGIDILITSNMGMNEPASAYNSETRMIALNYSSRVAAASDFFGVEDVPYYAITMGIATILKSKEIYFLAWGEGSGNSVKALVEGDVDSMNPASYLQEHKNIHVFIDDSA
ncbi:MAG: 6-phosphogluconolactonase, partial [Bacteroidales bacterium]|nr:6-phosphogluconolactonase [Bacteroidales bacterium]